MTSPSLSKTSKSLLSALLFALVFAVSVVRAQEYTDEEFKAYENVKAATEPAQKAELAAKFFQQYPKTTLKQQVMFEYQNGMVALQKEKSWTTIINAGSKVLAAVPGDEFTIGYLTAAYESTGNTREFAAFAEKMYAAKPEANLAVAIASAYQKLGNDAKFMQWAEKVLANDPDNVGIAAELTGKYLRNQNFTQAGKYARILIKGLPTAKKPENVDAKDWKNAQDGYYFTGYYALGAIAFNSNNFAQTILNLDNAVKYNKRSDMAYYYLGMSYWQTNKLQPAMLNFAKAAVIKGSTAAAARQNLEKLWKSGHRNSLAGIDSVYQRAQQDLK